MTETEHPYQTVALATVRGVYDVRVLRTDAVDDDVWWVSARAVKGYRMHSRTQVKDIRPLFVVGIEPDEVWVTARNMHGLADQIEQQRKERGA